MHKFVKVIDDGKATPFNTRQLLRAPHLETSKLEVIRYEGTFTLVYHPDLDGHNGGGTDIEFQDRDRLGDHLWFIPTGRLKEVNKMLENE